MRLVELGSVGEPSYGDDEGRGLNFCVQITFGPGGASQGFGALFFDTQEQGDDFVADLCETFGVTKLADIEGKPCVALRCFPGLHSTIEALEAEGGRRFEMTAWRRKWFPASPDPLEQERASMQLRIEQLESELARARRVLAGVDARYTPLPATAFPAELAS